MTSSYRSLNDSERHRIDAALRGLASPQIETHLQTLLHFVEGDPWVCSAVVKQTSAIAQLVSVLEGSLGQCTAAASTTALDILAVLSMRTQSARVATPFVATDGMRVLVKQLNHCDSSADIALATFLEQLFCGSEAENARTAAASAGLVQKIVSRMTSHEAPHVSISAFARVFVVAAPWHVARKQSEAHYAVDTLFRTLDNHIPALIQERAEVGDGFLSAAEAEQQQLQQMATVVALHQQNSHNNSNNNNNMMTSPNAAEQHAHQQYHGGVILHHSSAGVAHPAAIVLSSGSMTPVADCYSHVLRCLVALVSKHPDNAMTACSEKHLAIMSRLVAVLARDTNPSRIIAMVLWLVFSIVSSCGGAGCTDPRQQSLQTRLEEQMKACLNNGFRQAQQQHMMNAMATEQSPSVIISSPASEDAGLSSSATLAPPPPPPPRVASAGSRPASGGPGASSSSSASSSQQYILGPNTWSLQLASFRHLVAQMPQLIDTIRRDHLRTELVAEALRDLCNGATQTAHGVSRALARHVIGNPSMIQSLLLPMACVDEDIVTRTCQLLDFAVEGNPSAARTFLFLGGVLTLKDVLDDYSAAVLYHALSLTQHLAQDGWVMRELAERGVIARIMHMAVEELEADVQNPRANFDQSCRRPGSSGASRSATPTSASCAGPSPTLFVAAASSSASSSSVTAVGSGVAAVREAAAAAAAASAHMQQMQSSNSSGNNSAVNSGRRSGENIGGSHSVINITPSEEQQQYQQQQQQTGSARSGAGGSARSGTGGDRAPPAPRPSSAGANNNNNNSNNNTGGSNNAIEAALAAGGSAARDLLVATLLQSSSAFCKSNFLTADVASMLGSQRRSFSALWRPLIAWVKCIAGEITRGGGQIYPQFESLFPVVCDTASALVRSVLFRSAPPEEMGKGAMPSLSEAASVVAAVLKTLTTQQQQLMQQQQQQQHDGNSKNSGGNTSSSNNNNSNSNSLRYFYAIDGLHVVSCLYFLASCCAVDPSSEGECQLQLIQKSGAIDTVSTFISGPPGHGRIAAWTFLAAVSSRISAAQKAVAASSTIVSVMEAKIRDGCSVLNRATALPRASGRPRSASAPVTQTMSLLQRVLECADHIFQVKSKEYCFGLALDVGNILSHANASMNVRSAALDVLQAMFVSAPGANYNYNNNNNNNGTKTNLPTVQNPPPLIIPHLVQLLILCEDTEEIEAVTMVANRAFKLLLSLPAARTMATLFKIACDALEIMNITGIGRSSFLQQHKQQQMHQMQQQQQQSSSNQQPQSMSRPAAAGASSSSSGSTVSFPNNNNINNSSQLLDCSSVSSSVGGTNHNSNNNNWPWAPLPPLCDADDGHDLLVSLLPLINGLLHHETACCEALFLDANAWSFFFVLADARELQLGLRVLSLLALGNMLAKCKTAAKVSVFFQSPTLRSQFATALSGLLALPSSIDEIRHPAVGAALASRREQRRLQQLKRQEIRQHSRAGSEQGHHQQQQQQQAQQEEEEMYLPDEAIETVFFILDRVTSFGRKLQAPSFFVPQGGGGGGGAVTSSPDEPVDRNRQQTEEERVCCAPLLEVLFCGCFSPNESVADCGRSLLYVVFQADGVADRLPAHLRQQLRVVLSGIVAEMEPDAAATDSRRQAQAILGAMET